MADQQAQGLTYTVPAAAEREASNPDGARPEKAVFPASSSDTLQHTRSHGERDKETEAMKGTNGDVNDTDDANVNNIPTSGSGEASAAIEDDTEGDGNADEAAAADGGELAPAVTAASSYAAVQLSPMREMLFVALVCSAQLVTQAGLAQGLTILYVIGANFGITDPGELSWFMAAYSLTVGTFILVSGRLGDLFGHKRMVVIGFSWFALWTMVAGLSVFSNHILFIIARALQGIGPSILLPNALAIFGSTYPPGQRKNMVFSIFGAMAPGGSVIGGAFAALFAERAWWPWAYWTFALVLVGLAVLASIVVPTPPAEADAAHGHHPARGNLLEEIDVLGGAVGIAALVLINVAFNQAPVAGWNSPSVIAILIVGVALVPVFFLVELRVARKPLLPLDALQSSDIAWVLACLACGWGCFGIWFYYLWQFYLTLRHGSPLLTSAWTCPTAVSGAIAALVTGRILHIIGAAWTMVCSMTFFLIGILLVATMPVDQTYWAQGFVCVLVITWGMDMSFPAATVILSNAVKKRHQGIGASLVNTVVNYSISLALGFAGTAEVHQNNGGHNPDDTLRGYRAALYVGVGFAGLGWVLSIMFLLHDRHQRTRVAVKEKQGRGGPEGS